MIATGAAFRKIHHKVERQVYGTLRNEKELRRLRADGSLVCRSIASAIESTLGSNLDPALRPIVTSIETLRAQLSADDSLVSGIDYGAGARDASRTAEEMQHGVLWEKPVARIVRASKNQLWCTLLLQLIRELQPERCLELGTCVGISAAYQAAGLQRNGRGSLLSIEGAESLAAMARRHLQALGIERVQVIEGTFQSKLPQALDALGRVHFAYIDGHHDEQATLSYFKQILPHVPIEGVLVFDDIHWSAGMQRAWRSIVADDSIQVAVDLFSVGICVVGDGQQMKRYFRVAID